MLSFLILNRRRLVQVKPTFYHTIRNLTVKFIMSQIYRLYSLLLYTSCIPKTVFLKAVRLVEKSVPCSWKTEVHYYYIVKEINKSTEYSKGRSIDLTKSYYIQSIIQTPPKFKEIYTFLQQKWERKKNEENKNSIYCSILDNRRRTINWSIAMDVYTNSWVECLSYSAGRFSLARDR